MLIGCWALLLALVFPGVSYSSELCGYMHEETLWKQWAWEHRLRMNGSELRSAGHSHRLELHSRDHL